MNIIFIFQDKNDGLWIGSVRGLHYYHPDKTEKAVVFNQMNLTFGHPKRLETV